MVEYVENIIKMCTNLDPMAAVITLLALFLLFILWRESKQESLDWKDMVTSKGSNKVALTKMLQLVGGVTGTWMIIYTTLKGQLTPELFLIYLTYVGAIEGWSKFVAAKYGFTPATPAHKPKEPPAAKPPVDVDG